MINQNNNPHNDVFTNQRTHNNQDAEFDAMLNVFSPKTNAEQNAIGQPPKQEKRPRKLSSILVTKSEGFVMWLILLLLVVTCSVTMQRSLNMINAELKSQIEGLNYQVTSLMVANNALSAKLDAYLNAKNPVNITVNVDGKTEDFIYDSNTGEIIDPDDTQNEMLDVEFDTRPFLGVAFYENDKSTINPLGLKIGYVYESSPAAFAGIKSGDIIIAINGEKVDSLETLNTIILGHQANDTLKIQIATSTENGIEVIEVDAKLTYRGNFDFGEQE